MLETIVTLFAFGMLALPTPSTMTPQEIAATICRHAGQAALLATTYRDTGLSPSAAMAQSEDDWQTLLVETRQTDPDQRAFRLLRKGYEQALIPLTYQTPLYRSFGDQAESLCLQIFYGKS